MAKMAITAKGTRRSDGPLLESARRALLFCLGVAGSALCLPLRADASVRAEFGGNFRMEGAPPVRWTARASDNGGGAENHFDFIAEGDGLDLRATLIRAAGDAPVRWRLERGTLELSSWIPALGKRLAPRGGLEGWRFGGQGILQGEGEFADGRLLGRLVVRLLKAQAKNDEKAIHASGIEVRLRCADLKDFVLTPGQTVYIEHLEIAGIRLDKVALQFARDDGGVFKVSRAEANAFGGHLSLDPFEIDPARPRISTGLSFARLSLLELIRLVPTAVSNAGGYLNGRGVIDWELASTVPERIEVRVDSPDTAQLQLVPKPGFLSSGVPPRIVFLPGRLAGLFSAPNPIFRPLVDIERGEHALTVEAMELTLVPRSAGGHSARLLLQTSPASPADRKAIKGLSLEINVNGSLSEVISLGLDKRLQSP